MNYGATSLPPSIDGGPSTVENSQLDLDAANVGNDSSNVVATTTRNRSWFLARCQSGCRPVSWGKEQSFVLCVVTTVFLAWLNPRLSIRYLYPDITAQWIAVVIIFLCAGLNLKTSALTKALWNVNFNAFVQTFNFVGVSLFVYSVTKGVKALDILENPALADGMVVCASLPMAINMVVVLCRASNGDEAAAVFNATLSNLLGVFVSPLLIPLYVGVTGNVAYSAVFWSLTLKVVCPVLIGQTFHYFVPSVHDALHHWKRLFGLIPQCCLLFIIYTVFCQTFHDASANNRDDATTSITVSDVTLMIWYELCLMSILMMIAWKCLEHLFPDEPKLRVMGLFGCTHKTVSIGVPLIGAIYHGNPSVGLYTLPLLIWNPMQLVLGSLLAPYLSAFVAREYERLGWIDDDADDTTDYRSAATKLNANGDNGETTERVQLLPLLPPSAR